MSWEPRPTPEVNPETEAYWAAASDDILLLSECSECGLVYCYPREYCPDCFSDNVSELPADGTGTIYAFTSMDDVVEWPSEHLPLVVCYVELDEGPRMMTNFVDVGPETVNIGDRVRVKFVPTQSQSVSIPVFELV